jgi:penicillin amidase
MVLDVGDWDAGLAINCPGQSGDPASAHYRDLFPIWAEEGYFPLVFSPEAIAKAAEQRILLEPA